MKHVQKVVIDGTKKVIVTVLKTGEVKVSTDGQTATSDNLLYTTDYSENNAYVVIDDSTPVAAYGFQDCKCN